MLDATAAYLTITERAGSFTLYSAHDNTIMAMLAHLGMLDSIPLLPSPPSDTLRQLLLKGATTSIAADLRRQHPHLAAVLLPGGTRCPRRHASAPTLCVY